MVLVKVRYSVLSEQVKLIIFVPSMFECNIWILVYLLIKEFNQLKTTLLHLVDIIFFEKGN